jgi:diguanylate cyclase (GGDEF)-like protein/PAS domain S-box-containing protein
MTQVLDPVPPSWQDVVEALPDGTALIDITGTIRYANRILCTAVGYTLDELIGQPVSLLTPPVHEERAREAEARHTNGDLGQSIVWNDVGLSALCKDGSEFPVDFALTALRFGDEDWALISVRDNRERRAYEQAIVEAERNFRLAFEDNMSPMLFTDLDDCVTAVNGAFCELIGRSPEELVGNQFQLFTHSDDIANAEKVHQMLLSGEATQLSYTKRHMHSDGHIITAEVFKSPARDKDGKILYFIISERDVTEERELRAQLTYQAHHDSLTGLANRTLLDDRLARASSRMARHGTYCALLLLDLDDFKAVNDEHLHIAGDALLVEVASRLSKVARESDTLCRFGGDEFLYLAEDLASPEEADLIAARLMATFDEPFVLGPLTIQQRASLGVSIWGADDSNALRDADAALYEAKRRGVAHYS